MRHVPLRELDYAIGFIVLMAALYAGTYYATVTSSNGYICRVWTEGDKAKAIVRYLPEYPVHAEVVGWIFTPMHELDVKLRPGEWYCKGLCPKEGFEAVGAP